MAAVTLAQELNLRNEKIEKGVIKTFVEESPFGRRIPFVTTGSLQVPVVYQSGIPAASLRFINEAVSTQTADFSQMTETLHIFDADIDIDPVLVANKNQIQRVDVAQTQSKLKAMAYDLVDYAVNGNPLTNIREPRGLKVRLQDDPKFSGQTINFHASGTTEYELRVGTATDGNYRFLLHKLNELFYRVDNKPDVLLTNAQMILTLWAALQQLKLFSQDKDQYERTVMNYRGAQIIDAGWKAAGAIEGDFAAAAAGGDQVIGNDSEATTVVNGGLAYSGQTPIYAVRFGPEHYQGLQQEPMKVTKFGQIDDSPHPFRTNVRWVVQPSALFQKRAAGRLIGGAVSTAPAA